MLKNVLRWFFIIPGFILLLMCVLAFTRLPFDIHRWLGTNDSELNFTPDVIVMLGGSGMPSESNLIRLFYTAHVAEMYERAPIIIAHPIDISVAQSMKKYLINSKVDSSRIHLMLKGTNTREQAMELDFSFPGFKNRKIAVITAPENMYRTMLVFRKLGFSQVGGVSPFENAMFVDLNYSHKKLGGKAFTPDVSSNLDLRYNFWNYLKLEITCLRELVAIAYYKLNGWI